MSKRKDRQAEHKHLKKFLESSKDSLKRLKSLNQGLEKSSDDEVKAFYSEHSSAIFYCVYSSFTIIEANIHDRVARGKGYSEVFLKDMLELVLPALQRVLELLPELIHKGWQFNSICTIVRKLFHPQNGLRMKQFGIKLLVLWVQALQENAGDACMELFASAIPFFPPEKTPMGLPTSSTHSVTTPPVSSTGTLCERYGVYSTSAVSSSEASVLHRSQSGTSPVKDVVSVGVIYPLSLPPTDDQETVTMELMDYLLKCLTSQVYPLHWEDPSMFVRGFGFLFFLFKLFYLAPLYKEFRTQAGLYTQSPPPRIDGSSESEPGLQSVQEEPLKDSDEPDSDHTHTTPPVSRRKHGRTSPYRMSSVIKLEYNTSHPIYGKVQDLILKYVLMWALPSGSQRGGVALEGVSSSPASTPTFSRRSGLSVNSAELMREMWFTNRDNVSLLLEICRVGFRTPLSQAPTLRKLSDLYFHWEQTNQKPPFMSTPPVQSYGETTPTTPSLQANSDHAHSAASRSFILSWEQLSCYEGFKPIPVQAGLQSSLRMVVSHTSQLFFKKHASKEELDHQAEMCRKILRLYQDMAVLGDMDHETWEYCLAVLLRLTVALLPPSPPTNRTSTLGGTLADLLLRTLLVYYVRASMSTKVSPSLWDDLLTVVSSLTQWGEVVKEWQFVMSSMTSILAKTVYGLNLLELPLDKLEKDEHTRGSRRPTTVRDVNRGLHLDSFSAIDTLPSIRHVQRRDTADGRIRHTSSKRPHPHLKLIGKSSTESEPNSPQMDGHPGIEKRGSLPSDLATAPVKTAATPPLFALKEASEDSPTPVPSPEPVVPPLRSITTSTLVSGKLAEEKQALIDRGSIPSPGAISLPAEFILEDNESFEDSTTPVSEQPPQISKEEARKASLFVNPAMGTPSPDTILSGDTKFFPTDEEVSKKASPSHEGSGMSKKDVSKSVQSKKKYLPPDLVLSNKNASDTDQDSPRLRRIRLYSEDPSSSPLVTAEEDIDSATGSRRLSTLRKSSSEGNIHRISSSTTTRKSPRMGGSESGCVIRRVASTNVDQNEPSSAGSETFAHAASSPSISPPASVKRFNQSKSERRSNSPPTSPSRGQGGWTAESAAIVWQRMLKILGDVNEIHDPDIHSEAMNCLEDTWKSLVSMSANLGIPIGSSPTPPLPNFVPPLSIFLPWVIRACSLPRSYSGGRGTAYKLLCRMIIRHWHSLPSEAELAHFYRLMHNALQPDSDMLHTAVRSGCKLFSHSLPGSSILLKDSINAVECLLTSSTKNSLPRNEALFLLGSLLCLPDQYTRVPVISDGVEVCVSEGVKLKEQLIQLLYRLAKTEPFRNSRCLAIFQLGLLLFIELQADRASPRIPEGIDILLATLQFSDRTVSMAAVDMLSLLVEVAPQITALYSSLPAKILQAICCAIAMFLSDEQEGSTWLDKVIVTLLLCLRDWLVVLPIPQMVQNGSLENSTLTSVFEVLQVAAGSSEHVSKQLFTIKNPVNLKLSSIDHTSSRSPRGELNRRSRKDRTIKNGEDVQLSFERQSTTGSSTHQSTGSSTHQGRKDKVQIAARSVITHLINLLGHFPFACGTAQMGSVVCEYHDQPSLHHLSELSSEIFDSPRVQFFSFNNTAIVTLVEIPAQPSGVPSSVKTVSYQTRVIVRDVSGKYTWDCTVLYGPEKSATHNDQPPLLTSAETLESLAGYFQLIRPTPQLPDPPTLPSDPLQPPSWRTHANTGRDVLEDLLLHIESTSPECLLYPGTVGLCEAVPVGSGVGVSDSVRETEEEMVRLLDQQLHNEQQYIRETQVLPNMQGERAAAPQFDPSPLAFHHCRLFLSHLGMLSWEKRNHLDLLEKSNQLILELKHLDNIQAQTCRQTYKVAVLYIAPGQEDKGSIFSNNRGSREYEEFLAGLGWEVEMKTHTGYMGGLKREFCADCTLPYYATSSEEVLFHVATRLPLKMDQKVRHLGNDFVHIVWSEHWRDYRRTTFKTQFGDVLIVIYPQASGLFRVQINIEKKSNVSQFGPLFDGALVTRESLPALVRATAINGLRALRSSLIGSRGRYEERLQTIHTITKMKLMSSFEEFSENVMHPLEMPSSQPAVSSSRIATPKQSHTSPFTIPNYRAPRLSHPHKEASPSPHSQSLHHSRSHSPKSFLVSSLLKLPSLKDRAMERFSPPTKRQRASTNDDRMQTSPKVKGIRRNSSVPENLSEIGKELSKSDSKKSPDMMHSLTVSSMH